MVEVRRDGDETSTGEPRQECVGPCRHHSSKSQSAVVEIIFHFLSISDRNRHPRVTVTIVVAGTSMLTWRRCLEMLPVVDRSSRGGWSGNQMNRRGIPT